MEADRIKKSAAPVFCHACAEKAFRIWKGWCAAGTAGWAAEQKALTALPDLPEMIDGQCPACGAGEGLPAGRIFYQNIHGPYNTGLPDYFILRIAKELVPDDDFYNKFGRPYRDRGIERISLASLPDHVEEHYP